jgi:DNA polymerase I-like protein with 3'-5' exonuclease and polymerase domains
VAQEVGLKVSARIIRNWKNAYPEMLEYFAEINQQCEESDTGLFTLTQHKSGRLRGQVGYTDGANTMFQGLTADGAKDALRQVVRECYDPTARVNGKRSALYGCRVVVFVHDEIIIEAPALNATRATKRLKDAMREAMDRWVSDVPNDTDAAVMGRWFKGAKQVKYDERTTGVYRPVRATKDKIVVDLDKRLVYIGDRTEPLQEQQEV